MHTRTGDTHREIATCDQNEKFSKTEKIQKFAKCTMRKKNAPNQNIPKIFSAKNGQKKKVSKKKIGTKPLKQTPCPNR